MRIEERKVIFGKAEDWVNPLIERARKAESIQENVEVLRSWVVDRQNAHIDRYGNFTFARRVRSKLDNRRLTFRFTATDPTDTDAIVNLKFALKIALKMSEIPPDGQRNLDLEFRYGSPDAPFEPGDESLQDLYCHIFASDNATGVILPTELRKLTDLRPEELEMVNDLTQTAASFVPPIVKQEIF